MSDAQQVTEERVLFFLAHHGPLTFRRIAELVAARPAVLFGPADEAVLRTLLYSMWQGGLIAGAKEDERLVGWGLTDRGRKVAQHA
jgi:hypothetical protein